MPRNTTSLASGIRKLHHHHQKRWCGYLLPREILALLPRVLPNGNYWKDMDYIKAKVATGDGRPVWFYCEPDKALLETLIDRELKLQKSV